MPRRRRHLFTLLAVASVVMCVATLSLWLTDHTIHVELDEPTATRPSERWLAAYRGRVGYYRMENVILGPTASALSVTAYDAPLPAVAGSLAIAPAVWVVLFAWRKRMRRHGHCPACDYDLRASPERCPECGTAIGDPSR